ncbi:zinc-dependent alcohol dehydrogenase [Polyangium jinanense]|uniref:Glutathione-dependent formaldehyde dehydrogenase n=1 Tax=Polyangium jinanense TaxID=2829994 RepID=A0A9X3XBH9_9BACT|nr:zinc-dependent alcohol dehydrogenase [Polyangium jinanense]MDC3959171.1 glutathione-dependent formaldehyde dehydrogenase [Polyangium jinanense]MDC3987609.1 glutathione-dependent formaldehyde dehydrogenase [Polyangium jinanense]
MQALCYQGVNRVGIETVPDPEILGPHDAILRVTMSSVCGSDLHLLDGYVPTMRQGDIIGHEFIGEVVEVATDVKKLRPGMRVVVGSIIGCGHCFFCQSEQYSLCDNTNPNPEITDKLFGYPTAGIYGYSHAFGGFAGSHATYVRVPFADTNAFEVPDGLPDERALFASDALPTGYMGADLCNIQRGDVVAVWGCGGVGQMAILSAYLLGAERVIAIDRFPERLAMARDRAGAEILDYEQVDVREALREMTGGRGPDACIDCVGMEAHGTGIDYAYDRVKQAVRLETDRPTVLRQAILACRKGGTVSIMGVYGGFVDKFPMGAAMNKGLTLKMGQQHGQRYIPRLLEHIRKGELDPSYLITHRARLADGQEAYDTFKEKRDGCMRVVFTPEA